MGPGNTLPYDDDWPGQADAEDPCAGESPGYSVDCVDGAWYFQQTSLFNQCAFKPIVGLPGNPILGEVISCKPLHLRFIGEFLCSFGVPCGPDNTAVQIDLME